MDRLPHVPGAEPLDLRVAAVFAAVIAVLVAPSIPPVLSPLDSQELGDVASRLDSDAREAVQVVATHGRTTPIVFSSELSDIAASAEELRSGLVRSPVDPRAAALRTRVLAAAAALGDAAEAASVAYDDAATLTKARDALGRVVHELDGISGS